MPRRSARVDPVNDIQPHASLIAGVGAMGLGGRSTTNSSKTSSKMSSSHSSSIFFKIEVYYAGLTCDLFHVLVQLLVLLVLMILLPASSPKSLTVMTTSPQICFRLHQERPSQDEDEDLQGREEVQVFKKIDKYRFTTRINAPAPFVPTVITDHQLLAWFCGA